MKELLVSIDEADGSGDNLVQFEEFFPSDVDMAIQHWELTHPGQSAITRLSSVELVRGAGLDVGKLERCQSQKKVARETAASPQKASAPAPAPSGQEFPTNAIVQKPPSGIFEGIGFFLVPHTIMAMRQSSG